MYWNLFFLHLNAKISQKKKENSWNRRFSHFLNTEATRKVRVGMKSLNCEFPGFNLLLTSTMICQLVIFKFWVFALLNLCFAVIKCRQPCQYWREWKSEFFVLIKYYLSANYYLWSKLNRTFLKSFFYKTNLLMKKIVSSAIKSAIYKV